MSELREHALTTARALPGLLREVAAARPRPILVAGAGAAAGDVASAFSRGGDPGLVRRVFLFELSEAAEAAALVYVIDGAPTPADEGALREADWRRVPTVCLLLGQRSGETLPYVRATDVVRADRVDEEALAALARRVAAGAGETAWCLARDLPALRGPLAESLVSGYARRNALAGAAAAPGRGMPVLTANQLRMILRVAGAHGVELRGAGLLPLAAVAGAALAFRGLARRLGGLGVLPAALVDAGVAYAGTRLLGEAARAVLGRERR